MRRLLLAAAVSVPIAVVAAIQTAPQGKVVELDNYNARTGVATSYINAAQCQDSVASPRLNLQWSVIGGASAGTYRIFASDTAPATTTSGDTVANYCPEKPTQDPEVNADQIDSAAWTSNTQGKMVSGSLAAAKANADCSATGEGDVLYICAHLIDPDGTTKRGYASGKFIVQVAAPDAPTISDVGAASETSLYVTWNAPTTGVQVDHYRAVATLDGVEVQGATTDGPATNATIRNLAEGTTYSVVVYAYSLGGNPSTASGAMDGTPGPVLDFWEIYEQAGGRDDGGCATGGAGPLALLGVAALLRLRRRK